MGDSQLEARDYLGTTLTDVVAVDMRSGIARLMGVGGASTAKSQLYTKLAMETVGCLADIGKAAATAGTTAATDVGQAGWEGRVKGRGGVEGLPGFRHDTGAGSRSAQRVECRQHVAHQGRGRVPDGGAQGDRGAARQAAGHAVALTQIAVKQILCVLTLFKTYFAHSGTKTLNSGTKHEKKIEGDVVKTEGGTTFTRQLELGRVKRGSLMSKLTSYSAHEEVELVEAMMGELERLYTLLTQAIQREQVRLQLAAKAADEWGEFQTAPSQNLI